MKNTYAGSLDIPEGVSGPVQVIHDIKPAGTKLSSVTFRTAMFGQKGEEILFDEQTRWHRLVEEEYGTWMTDLPIEQRQMDTLVKSAKGKVLIGGLGLGYAIIALVRRRRIREITVVERSADVIALVWNATVRRVEEMAEGGFVPKLTIVQADLHEYVTGLPSDAFAWALYDIWQTDSESTFHTVVLPLRQASKGKIGRIVCWNEDVMRGQLHQGLWLRIQFMGTPFQTPALDQLCETRNSIYHDWAVPFWRWYRSCGQFAPDSILKWIMQRYAQNYGILPAYLPDPIPDWFIQMAQRETSVQSS